MGWSIGFDPEWRRDIGYGVPAWCDHPDCIAEIDRGLSYVCGGQPRGGDTGCGLYFCERHLETVWDDDTDEVSRTDNGDELAQLCERCVQMHADPNHPPPLFTPKSEHPDWVNHKLTAESWQRWRDQCPEEVARLAV